MASLNDRVAPKMAIKQAWRRCWIGAHYKTNTASWMKNLVTIQATVPTETLFNDEVLGKKFNELKSDHK